MKTSAQLKNMVEDYIKLTPVKYQDSTALVQKQNPEVEWQFIIGQALHVTKIKNRDDRITFSYGVGISPVHKESFKKLMQSEPEFINGLNEMIMMRGCITKWVEENNEIKGVEISTYIDEQEFNRPNFYETWDRVNSLGNHIARTIGIKINPTAEKPTDSDTSSQSMYG